MLRYDCNDVLLSFTSRNERTNYYLRRAGSGVVRIGLLRVLTAKGD